MDILHVDTETFSTIDLRKSGLYHYAEAVEIMMVSWALNDQPVQLWDVTMGDPPKELMEMLRDPSVQKWSHNCPFERTVFNRAWGIDTDPRYWRCTAVLAASLGLPRSLADVGAAIGLPADRQKMAVGSSLIRYFCLPCKPTKTNGGRTRNFPRHDEAKWKLFGDYCRRDTEVERDIHHKLAKFPMLDAEWSLWELDQRINDRGLQVDMDLVKQAMLMDAEVSERLSAEAVRITGLSNPNSVAQLRKWLLEEQEIETETLDKKVVAELLESDQIDNNPVARRVLEIRKQMSKTSIKKYDALARWTCSDSRIRGIFLFNGASRTHRWSGQGFQPQNLARGTIESESDLTALRDLVKMGELGMVETLYGDSAQMLSNLIRTAIVAPRGKTLSVADLSAIEARVLAWYSQEEWRLEVFHTHGKIYEASASEMFKVPLDKIKKGNPEYALRQKGKIGELALGFLGGTGALIAMGALDMGLTEEELPEIVRLWRQASPSLMEFGYRMGDDAIEAVRTGAVIRRDKYAFGVRGPFLFLRLPSGRKLAYFRPMVEYDEKGRPFVSYMGVNQYTRKFERLSAWAGKWLENLVQATARDVLAVGLRRATLAGLTIVGHVHDEIICEADETDVSAEQRLVEAMSLPIDWAPGLPLAAAGYTTRFYRKD